MHPTVHFRQTPKPTEVHRAERPLDRSRPQTRDRALAKAMPLGTRRPPFDSVTLCLHWATALLVLGMFASAWLHALAEAHDSLYAAALIQVHRSLGTTIWVATTLRLVWRLTNAEPPPFPVSIGRECTALRDDGSRASLAFVVVALNTPAQFGGVDKLTERNVRRKG
jgi:hypothetical protein